MVNRSKANDPRFWKKWEESGAVGTIEDAYKIAQQNRTNELYTLTRSNDIEEDSFNSENLLKSTSRQFNFTMAKLPLVSAEEERDELVRTAYVIFAKTLDSPDKSQPYCDKCPAITGKDACSTRVYNSLKGSGAIEDKCALEERNLLNFNKQN